MAITSKPLGCFSLPAVAAALFSILVIAGISLFRGGALFSPGALNAEPGSAQGGVQSHAELSERCGACHTAPWSSRVMADRCLDCHFSLLDDPKDFHSLMLAEGRLSNCWRCHSEHNGAQAALTLLDLDQFPHDAAGYALRAHQTLADGSAFTCSSCHQGDFSDFDPLVCAVCHTQIDAAYLLAHSAVFGPACLDCHDGLDTYGAGFDHNLLAFPLAGRHAAQDCAACHSNARSLPDLRAAPQDCAACHAADDAHAGRLGTDCAVCHTPEGWEEADFDHGRAAFALTGRHVEAPCESCHVEGPAGKIFQGTPQDCFACHAADDAHQGQYGQDCAGCHTPEGWEEADFDHSLAAFQLTGAHLAAACAACHVDGVFKGTPQVCSACHTEPDYHGGLFSLDCQACHTTDAWRPAAFDQPHTFPINHGERGGSSCQTCHPDALQVYTCYGCHEHTPDNIAEEHREEGIGDFQDCMRCHPNGEEGEGD